MESEKERFLLFGGNGWIGSQLGELLRNSNQIFSVAKSRIENREELIKEINETNPHFVINCAGKVI